MGIPRRSYGVGESAEETAIREVKEETGVTILVEKLIGVYTKYFDRYANGDQAQTISFFYQGRISDGELISSNEKSIEVQFFDPDEVPELFNQQHTDAFNDFRAQRVGVSR